MARLIFLDPAFAGQVYELTLPRIPVGRSNRNKLVIRDESVSLEHCEILVNGPEIIVRDLDSTNGTFIESTRLRGQAQAKSGQTVRFGSVRARLELGAADRISDASELTAIHEVGRLAREAKQSSGADAGGATRHLSDPEHGVGDDQTVLIPGGAAVSGGAGSGQAAPSGADRPIEDGGGGWWIWLVLAVLGAALIWYFGR